MNIFNPSFWFSYQPPVMLMLYLYIFAGFFTAVLIAGIVLLQRSVVLNTVSDQKHVQSWLIRFGKSLILVASTGYLWLFFSWQQVAFLGSRFWILLWMIYFIWILIFFLKEKYIILPKKRVIWEQTQKFKQYLPKKKK